MKIAVAGTGYVGLVSGVCLASRGHEVTCVDLNPEIVAKLNAGEPTIYERGLSELLTQVRDGGAFKATTDLNAALENADAVIIAVGTPSEDGIIDLRYIRAVAREIGTWIRNNDRFLTVIVKSTVVPGTTDTVVRGEIEAASGKTLGQFGLGMNPEFLREGEAIEDFAFPDRIVLGHEDSRTLEVLEEIYASWDVDKVRVNTRTAEFIKYANNALLAIQISAVNEIANLAAAVGGVDVLDVVKGVCLDKRWNPLVRGERANPQILTYLVPGCGFGGSCFPKDVQALRSQGEERGMPMRILNAVLDVNERQPQQVMKILTRECGDLAGRKVMLLGLAFKPETDDVRESASLKIAASLLAVGADVTAHDPIAVEHFKRSFGADADRITYVANWQAELADHAIVIVATKWAEYQQLEARDVAGKVIFDARRLLAPAALAGAKYLSIGRTNVQSDEQRP